jgi:cellulose synthase operon protein C
VSESHDELRVRVGMYFDGELPPVDERAVLDHLAVCAQCQDELGGVMALDTALQHERVVAEVSAPAPEPEPAPAPVPAPVPVPVPVRHRRRAYLVGGTVAIAAALAIYVGTRSRDRGTEPAPTVAITLPATRVLEARFEAPAFAAHRPYAVTRSGATREEISLDLLAALERAHRTADLVAALAAAGDLARAAAIAEAQPDAISLADRAALALAAGHPDEAVALLDQRAVTPAARWNLALAALELGLTAVAERHFTALAALDEPGWRDEARRHATALGAAGPAEEHRRFDDFSRRALAMIAGTGPAITPADVAAFPAFARIYFLDALRVAPDRDAALELAPIAAALDAATRTPHARAALDRAARALAEAAPTRRAFHAEYRALVAGTFDRTRAPDLLARLERAGPTVDDLYFGAVIWSGQAAAHLAELRARAGDDPWLLLAVDRERLARDRRALGGAAVVERLRAAVDACGAAWAYRCAGLALDAAEALVEVGRVDDALEYTRRASALFAAAHVPMAIDNALLYLGELARYRDLRALARLTFEEVELRTGTSSCALSEYARIGRSQLALLAGDVATARALLPEPTACKLTPTPDQIGLITAVDLARRTGDPADRNAAERWAAAARAVDDPHLAGLAAIATSRLALAADPGDAAAESALRAIVTGAAPAADTGRATRRAWATSGLVSAAGQRAAWARVADAAAAEIGSSEAPGRELQAPRVEGCLLIASVDDDRRTIAVRDAAGAWSGEAWRAPLSELDPATFVPTDLLAKLGGCPRVAVIARPPLHGRTDLLPPALPWAFVGGPAHATPTRPPRTVIVTDALPPVTALRLPRLAPAGPGPAGATVIRGAAATPSRVLAELATATYIEIDAHGVADIETSDASFLALSPDPSGQFTLTAAAIRGATLSGAVVVLAACRSARLAPYLNRRWTLPDAFLAAGARAVIATDVDIPDPAAAAVFTQLRERIERGEAPAAALAAIRKTAPPTSWIARVAVFE